MGSRECPHHRHRPHCPLHHPHCPHCPLHNPLPISANTQISQELEHIELVDEEQDDDPIFVLTDEWREFFAKSEARRKLEKKQSKKGKK